MHERALLVGTDMGVRGDDAIVEGLTLLGARPDAVLHVLHVMEPDNVHHASGTHGMAQEAAALTEAPLALQRRVQYDAVLNGLPYTPERIRHHVRLGKPIETLLQACVDYDADILIVGTHGRRGLQQLLLGSVAVELLRRARCPVLVARPKNYHGISKSPPVAQSGRA